MRKRMAAVLAGLVVCFFASLLSVSERPIARAKTNTVWFFVEIEAKLYRKDQFLPSA
jgi:hypothetical protein